MILITASTTADLPASIPPIGTTRRLGRFHPRRSNPSLTAIEGPGSSVRAAAANAFFIPEGPPEPEYRYIVRLSLKLQTDWRTGKIWENGKRSIGLNLCNPTCDDKIVILPAIAPLLVNPGNPTNSALKSGL